MNQVLKEYKTQIAIIIGAIIIGFSIYYSSTHEVRTKIKKCVEDGGYKSKKMIERRKEFCTGNVLKFGRW